MGSLDSHPEKRAASGSERAGPNMLESDPPVAREADGAIDKSLFLALMEQWDERYHAGKNLGPESRGITDPLLEKAVHEAIGRQMRLYARLKLSATLADRGDAADEPLPRFPDHETLARIGQGGMGTVYEARDTKLGRVVAIKTIAAGQYATAEQRERFCSEAQAVARLRHPHIIAIHSVGDHEGQPYFSMEYAAGGSLAQKLAQGPTTTREAAELVETLARAMNAAHQAGIVHRDLKPSNVLLTAEGVPKVSDFGLAKLIDGDSAQTLSGQVLGSPSYMAPEQAQGHSKQVGPAADVYALGAILYKALTGKPPFLGESPLETLKLVVSTEVVPLRRQRPGVPRDFETICLTCLQKDPRRRYATAQAMADDLQRFRQGRPILARRASRSERTVRWCRRNPWVVAFLLALALGVAATTWLAVRARKSERDAIGAGVRARAERDRAVQARDRALGAVQIFLTTGKEALGVEEFRPYRKSLIAAGLRESQALVHELEGDLRAEFQLIEAYCSLALVQHAGGEYALALESAHKALALAEKRLASDPASIVANEKLGDVLHRISTTTANVDQCLAAARRSTEIYRELCAAHPDGDRRNWIKQIARNEFNTGNFLWGIGIKSHSEAMKSFLAARSAYEELDRLGDRAAETRDLAGRNLLFLCRLYYSDKHYADSIAAGGQAGDGDLPEARGRPSRELRLRTSAFSRACGNRAESSSG